MQGQQFPPAKSGPERHDYNWVDGMIAELLDNIGDLPSRENLNFLFFDLGRFHDADYIAKHLLAFDGAGKGTVQDTVSMADVARSELTCPP